MTATAIKTCPHVAEITAKGLVCQQCREVLFKEVTQQEAVSDLCACCINGDCEVCPCRLARVLGGRGRQ